MKLQRSATRTGRATEAEKREIAALGNSGRTALEDFLRKRELEKQQKQAVRMTAAQMREQEELGRRIENIHEDDKMSSRRWSTTTNRRRRHCMWSNSSTKPGLGGPRNHSEIA
jgi:hypothetical protein